MSNYIVIADYKGQYHLSQGSIIDSDVRDVVAMQRDGVSMVAIPFGLQEQVEREAGRVATQRKNQGRVGTDGQSAAALLTVPGVFEGGEGGFSFGVGPVGSGAAFTDIQDAIDAAPSGSTIIVLGGSYSGFSIADKELSIVGTGGRSGIVTVNGDINISISLSGTRRVNMEGLSINGDINCGGSSNTLVWVKDLEVTDGMVNCTNTHPASTFIATGTVRVNQSDSAKNCFKSDGMRLDMEDAQWLHSDVSAMAMDTTADVFARNTRIWGVSRMLGALCSFSGAATQFVATGEPVDRSSATVYAPAHVHAPGAFFMIGGNIANLSGGDVLKGTSPSDAFVGSVVTGFGSVLDGSQATILTVT